LQIGMAIRVESYQLRRVRSPVVYRSKTKKDHDLQFDMTCGFYDYDTRFHAHVFGGTALISSAHGCCLSPAYKSSLSSPH
ncbi:hypothetical protein BT69DRAFT_1277188, partial [Atractiella rhizophila]